MRFLGLLLIAAGIVASGVGMLERRLAEGASVEPEAFPLARFEEQGAPDNPHLQIGPHWGLQHELVFTYRDTGQDPEALPPNTQILMSFYPVISTEHPAAREIAQLAKLYGGVEAIPVDQLPSVERFSMVVKTRRFGRVGDLPQHSFVESAGQSGMVINRVAGLGAEERALLEQSFPAVDLRRVAIFEAGRTPVSSTGSLAWVASGFAAIALGVAAFVVGRRQTARAALERIANAQPMRWMGDRLRVATCQGAETAHCWICGAANDRGEPEPRDFFYTPPGYALALFLGLLPGLILMAVGRRKLSLAIPTCWKCERVRKGRAMLANLHAILGLFAFPIGGFALWHVISPETSGWGAGLGVLLWVVGLVVLQRRLNSRQAICERIENGEAILRFPKPERTRRAMGRAA